MSFESEFLSSNVNKNSIQEFQLLSYSSIKIKILVLIKNPLITSYAAMFVNTTNVRTIKSSRSSNTASFWQN